MNKIVVFDIDGVIRDVGNSYRRAIADTVEHFTNGRYRPPMTDIDNLKSEGIWNNDWEASQELICRYFETQGTTRDSLGIDYETIVKFFQSRYRGDNWDGYITTEPLLLQASYLENLTKKGISWGFFSGATRGSAEYVLKKRLGLENLVLMAMEDAPGKPDPTGLLAVVQNLEQDNKPQPVIYVGDTVGDMYTVVKAKEKDPERVWIGVGVLPPHTQSDDKTKLAYTEKLKLAGAAVVLSNVQELTPDIIQELVETVRLL